jgi:RimJ/RimL family protein N-acetyltransferase
LPGGEAVSADWKPGQILTLKTAHYIVRSMTTDDVTPDYLAWTQDEEIMYGVNSTPGRMTMADLHKYVAQFNNRTSFHLGIFLKDSGRLIGFYSVYWEKRHNIAGTNVVIGDRSFWGKGVVLETRAAIIDFLFGRLKVNKVWGSPMARNISSVFNYKAQGFRCEGVLKRHRLSPKGEPLDQLMFGLFPEDWRKAKEAKPR